MLKYRPPQLSSREKVVLRMVLNGYSKREVAVSAGLDEEDVTAILRKTLEGLTDTPNA